MLQFISHSLARANPGETSTEMDVKNCQCYCGSWFSLGLLKMDHNFLWSVFTPVTSIYLNLLEKKECLHKKIVQVIKDCQSYCTGETQARERRVVKR